MRGEESFPRRAPADAETGQPDRSPDNPNKIAKCKKCSRICNSPCTGTLLSASNVMLFPVAVSASHSSRLSARTTSRDPARTTGEDVRTSAHVPDRGSGDHRPTIGAEGDAGHAVHFGWKLDAGHSLTDSPQAQGVETRRCETPAEIEELQLQIRGQKRVRSRHSRRTVPIKRSTNGCESGTAPS